MKLSDFNAALAKTRMGERARDAARLILVDGLSPTEAARQIAETTGEPMSRQAADKAARRIEAAHMAARGLPDGWECVTVCVPPEQVANVREIERLALRNAGLNVD